MKAVFDVNPGSRYKDDVWRRYDIPNRRQVDLVRGCIGDWILFRWTGRKVERGSYFAIARVVGIEDDPERPSFTFARIRDFLAFPTSVPLSPGGRYAETELLSAARPSQIGQLFQGRPIRRLWDADFDAIVRKGFSRTVHIGADDIPPAAEPTGFEEQRVEAWMHEPHLRRIGDVLRHLPFRDANFRLNVGRAYGHTCAFTGLKLMTSRGHCEAHAAHLWPVAEGGPDIVRNGICANRTIHWAIDEHQLSIDEANRPMVARNPRLLDYLRRFPEIREFVTLPHHPSQYPDPVFLAQHRAAFLRKNRI